VVSAQLEDHVPSLHRQAALGGTMSDAVTSPAHYRLGGGLEVLDVMEALGWAEGYLKANALKYLMRHEHKGKPVEDLKKARYCLDRLIGLLEAGAVRDARFTFTSTADQVDPGGSD
jgi:hypothetical protein